MNHNSRRRSVVQPKTKPIKVKVNNFLNFHLDTFEKKLKSKGLNRLNTQVPLMIINKFKRLLEIWNENESFSTYLKPDILEDIHSLLMEILKKYDCSPSTITLPDSQTATEFEQYASNILDHSYAVQASQLQNLDNSHEPITDVTKRMTRTDENDKGTFFRCFLCQISIPVNDYGGDSDDDSSANRSCLDDVINSHELDDEHRFNLLIFQSHENYVRIHNREEDTFRCILCGEIFHLHLLMEHFANSKHSKSKITSISESSRQDLNSIPIEFVTHIINDRGIFTKCYLCRTLIPVPTSTGVSKSTRDHFDDMAQAHKSSEIHTFNLLVFYSHWPYVKIHRNQEDTLSCTLCDTELNLDSFMDHLTSSKHTKLKLLSTCNVDVENFNELNINFIVQTTDDEGILTTCHLCRITICCGEPDAEMIEAHQRYVDHRFNFLVYKSHERFIRVLNCEKTFFPVYFVQSGVLFGGTNESFYRFRAYQVEVAFELWCVNFSVGF